MAIGEIKKEIIVGVGSSLLTGAIIWGLAQGGTFVRSIVLPDLPGDAVVMFDGKCPEGWGLYDEVGGRFVVGAGAHSNTDETGQRLEKYKPWASGGEERVALTTEQMPNHRHNVLGIGNKDGNGSNIIPENIALVADGANRGVIGTIDWGFTETTGNNQPHNNMPPYIALSFCKKD